MDLNKFSQAIQSFTDEPWLQQLALYKDQKLSVYYSPFEYINAREGENKRGNSSRLTQSFHFFMFEPIFYSRKCLESAYLDRFFAI